MTIAEMIYQHSLRLPEAQALEVLYFIEFIEQRQRQPPSSQVKWNGNRHWPVWTAYTLTGMGNPFLTGTPYMTI